MIGTRRLPGSLRPHAPRRALGACVLAALITSSSSSSRAIVDAGAASRPEAATAQTAEARVILVSIDGLRPDAITRSDAPAIGALMREGAYSLNARTTTPSKTLPAHASMLSGVEASAHGITWNDYDWGREDPDLVTVFSMADAAGMPVAAFFAKSKLRQLVHDGDTGHLVGPSRWSPFRWDDDRTADEVADFLADGHRPGLLVIHIAATDRAGHEHGWMSAEYREAVREVDADVEELVQHADAAFGAGGYTLILTADHGGLGFSHDGPDPRNSTVPWITWGRNVRRGVPLRGSIRVTDTAATIAWLLGIEPPCFWTGRALTAAYENGGRRKTPVHRSPCRPDHRSPGRAHRERRDVRPID